MKWTDRQREAIETRNQNILVSAAAGSGKTAVLVERIIRLVIEEKVDIDQLLVVTFTKAAASEMKAKIVKAIKKRIKEDPENSAFLRKQLQNMYKCSISTFHSFAIDVIRKYFYIIDINPNLSVADETQTAIMKQEVMDQIFFDEFERNSKEFLSFLRGYSSYKGESNIKESILKLYERIMALPEPFQWLGENVEILKDKEAFFGSRNYEVFSKLMEAEAKKKLADAIAYKKKIVSLCEEHFILKMQAKNQGDLDFVLKAMDLMEESKEEAAEFLMGFSPVRLAVTKDEKENYEVIKEEVKELNDEFKSLVREAGEILLSFADENINMLLETYPHLKTLQHLLEELHRVYSEYKLDKKIMDFNDIEHFTIEILKDEKVSAEIREKYKHIFIDEYQDSNYLQETIIGSICRENNLFMVGDIKQSIYRFRLAEPDIFREKYEIYGQDDIENSVKIDLNQNFRSKTHIINCINDIFVNIIKDYDDNAALKLGTAEKDGYRFPVELHIVEKDYEKGERADEVDEILDDLSSAEAEAYAALDYLEKIVGTDFYDSKQDIVRPLEYKDTVIIMRSVKGWGETFREVLEANGVSVFLNDSAGYFDTVEIALVLDLLKAIDNIGDDIALLGVLKSAVFDFSVSELIEIRMMNKGVPFNQAFIEYSKNGENLLLKEKCSKAIDRLYIWKNEARTMPIEQFVWKIIKESNIYLYAATLPDGTQKQLNLRTFVEKTEEYSKFGHNSIFGLLSYFENVKKNVEVGQSRAVTEEDDAVEITTIHKSKGLEYPVVIVPGINKRLRGDTKEEINMMHKDLGIGITWVSENSRRKENTILQKAISTIKTKEYIEEEIRVLYVAMTRAKDRLVLIGSVDDYNQYKEKALSIIGKNSSYLDFVFPHVSSANTVKKVMDKKFAGKYLAVDSGKRIEEKKRLLSKIRKDADRVNYDSIKELLEYKYAYEKDINTKSKYSVSEINRSDTRHIEIKKADFDKITDTSISSAERGTAYHTVMEHLSFSDVVASGREYIISKMDEMVNRQLLTEEERNAVEVEKIEKFFESEVGKRASASQVHREKTFTMVYEKDGCETLIQGIIDCYFEEMGEIVLVDYKSNRRFDHIDQEYKKQIEIYKEALEEATGKKVKECWLYLFEKGEGIRVD